MNDDIKSGGIRTLFLDIGGVILTNGWDRDARKKAVENFGLDGEELNERHHLTFDTYEEGKLTLDEYLERVVFYERRNFSKEAFREFMFEQSQPLEDTLGYFKSIKEQYHLKVIAVSNEGRELNEHRIRKYKLNELFDAYISSCYVHLRKPDRDMLRMACDISQTRPEEALYIDDRLMFVQVAQSYGIHALRHTGLDATKDFMSKCIFHHGIKNN
jgi:putative hydrolase of the HAD superfamily